MFVNVTGLVVGGGLPAATPVVFGASAAGLVLGLGFVALVLGLAVGCLGGGRDTRRGGARRRSASLLSPARKLRYRARRGTGRASIGIRRGALEGLLAPGQPATCDGALAPRRIGSG